MSKKSRFLLQTAKAIQWWRNLEGYTQETFASKIGTSRSYVARLESGHSGISFEKIEGISGFLEISPATLLSGLPEKQELNILLQFYTDDKITKQELESLFRARVKSKVLTHEYYIEMLRQIRLLK
jgi:transcriptional regulator with XRE-family HTH domain